MSSDWNQHDWNAQNHDQNARDKWNSGDTWGAACSQWEADAARSRAELQRTQEQSWNNTSQIYNNQNNYNQPTNYNYSGGYYGGRGNGFLSWLFVGIFKVLFWITKGLLKASLILIIPALIILELSFQVFFVKHEEEKQIFDRVPILSKSLYNLSQGENHFQFSNLKKEEQLNPAQLNIYEKSKKLSNETLINAIINEKNHKSNEKNYDKIVSYSYIIIERLKNGEKISEEVRKKFSDGMLINTYTSNIYYNKVEAANDYMALTERGFGKNNWNTKDLEDFKSYKSFDQKWVHFDHAYAILKNANHPNITYIEKAYIENHLKAPSVTNADHYNFSDGLCVYGYCLNFNNYQFRLIKEFK